jgi:hypothetical protein
MSVPTKPEYQCLRLLTPLSSWDRPIVVKQLGSAITRDEPGGVSSDVAEDPELL